MAAEYDLSFATEGSQSIWSANGPTEVADSITRSTTITGSASEGGFLLGTGLKGTVNATVTPGYTLAYELNPGTFDASVDFQTEIVAPEFRRGDAFSVNAGQAITGGLFESTSPTVKANLDLLLSASITATALGKIFGETLVDATDTVFSFPQIGTTFIELDGTEISVWPDIADTLSDTFSTLPGVLGTVNGYIAEQLIEDVTTFDFGEIEVSLDLVTAPAQGLSVEVAVDNISVDFGLSGTKTEIGSVTFGIPIVETSSGPGTNSFKVRGEDDLIDADLDLDTLLPVPGETTFEFNNFAGVTLDLFDIDFGPDIDVYQEFELTPALYVTLDFDKGVWVDGKLVDTVEVAFDDLEDLEFVVEEEVTVTPTFELLGFYNHETGLDLDMTTTLEALEASFYLGSGGVNLSTGVGPVFEDEFSEDYFELPAYQSSFIVDNFNTVIGESFVWTPQNEAPVAGDDTATTDENTPITIAAATLLGNDTDVDGDVLTITAVDGSRADALTLNADGSITYDPTGVFDYLAVGEEGTELFQYTVDDGFGGTDTGTVTVTVTGVNDDPVAGLDEETVGEDDGAITIDLLANDSDVDATDTLRVVSVDTTGTEGRVQLNADGTVSYDPDERFEALDEGETTVDSFTYTLTDDNGGTVTGTAEITIEGADDIATTVGRVNDWYNPSWGGGYVVEHVVEILDVIGDTVNAWSIDADVGEGTIVNGWVTGFNGGASASWDGTTASFSNADRGWQPTLEAGDTITIGLHVVGTGFDPDAITFDFTDLDARDPVDNSGANDAVGGTPPDDTDDGGGDSGDTGGTTPSVSLRIAEGGAWDSGGWVEIYATNDGTDTLELDDLAFDFLDDGLSIDNAWGLDLSGDRLEVAGWQPGASRGELGAGEEVKLGGFVYSKTDTNAELTQDDFAFV